MEYRFFFGDIGLAGFGMVGAYQKKREKVPEHLKRLAAERIREMRDTHG